MIQEFLIGFFLGFMLKPRKKMEEIGVQVSDTPLISQPILIPNSKIKFLKNFWGSDS
jgi:hypothetical protein